MKKSALKNVVGVLILLTQASCIGGIVLLMQDYLKPADGMDLLFVIAPIFSAYSMAVVRDFLMASKARADRRVVPFGYIFVSLLFPLLFATSLGAVLWGFKIGVLQEIDTLKRGVAIIETLFGVYLGAVTHELFGTVGGGNTSTPSPELSDV